MKKFYDKSEIWFAVAAIIIYVMLAGNMRSSFGDDSIQMLLTLGVLTVVIVWFLAKNRLFGKYGLTFWPDSRRFLYFIPFLVLGLTNLALGVRAHYSLPGQICAVLSMALVGFLEEIIFRGFLLEAIAKDSRKRALIISAVTFGVGHIVNLFTGQASLDTVLQVIYAIAIGFSLVVAYDRSSSLWPCIAMHSLVDVTSTFSNDVSPYAEASELPTVLFIIAVSLGYTWYMVKKCPKRT